MPRRRGSVPKRKIIPDPTFGDRLVAKFTNVVMWDGKNDRGSKMPSGVYFYVLNATGVTSSRKMVMLK